MMDMNESGQEVQQLIHAGRTLMDAFNKGRDVSEWVTMGHLVDHGTGYAFNLPLGGRDYTIVTYSWTPGRWRD